MKQLATLLLTLFSFSAFAQVAQRHLLVVNTVADLKQVPVDPDATVLTIGLMSRTDQQGAAYYYDPASTDAEDATYYNTVTSGLTSTGRWKRVNVKTQQLPHGTLNMSGGLKTFRGSGVTNSSGELTVNLTMDGTAAGAPIFTKLLFKQTNAVNAASSPNDFVWGGYKSASSDLKQITFKYIKVAAPLSITLGLLINFAANPPTGTPVEFWIEGQ